MNTGKELSDKVDAITEEIERAHSRFIVGPYAVCRYSPILRHNVKGDDQENAIWLTNLDTGEAMAVNLDKLWEQF